MAIVGLMGVTSKSVVVVSTAACGRRLGGGLALDGLFTGLVPRPRTDRGLAATPHSEPDLTPRTSLRAEQRACAPLFQGTSFPHLKWLRLPDQKWLSILDRSQSPLQRGTA